MFYPPLYLQLYSVWLVTESQRVMLQMMSNALAATSKVAGPAEDLGRQMMEAVPAPLDMPQVESTPV